MLGRLYSGTLHLGQAFKRLESGSECNGLPMVNPQLIASFPSNQLNSPPSILVIGSGVLLIVLLLAMLWTRSFFFGLCFGAVVFAVVAGVLFWPRVLREPRAPNPGPTVVIFGAVVGAFLGSASAVLGKVLYLLRSSRAGAVQIPSDEG